MANSESVSSEAPISGLGLRRRAPAEPSPRMPHKSTWFNRADITERLLRQDGHRTWGYVIYRTTYASDDDWNEFLRRLRFSLEYTFDKCNGRDILDAFALTVFSDASHLDNANTATIRQHFKQWAGEAWLAEQQPQSETMDEHVQGVRMGFNPRYHFCIQVDEASLHSVVFDAPPPLPRGLGADKGWVKLISKSWIPIEDDPRAGPGQPTFEPVDGVTERDVGWMKVPYGRVMLEFYSAESDLNGWRFEYCRPPAIAGAASVGC